MQGKLEARSILRCIHGALLFPHVVMLQPYSKIDQMNGFPQNSTKKIPHDVKVQEVGLQCLQMD